MADIAALTFTPDGAGHGLYTETIELAQLGRLTIRRATSIEYDNALQVWRVWAVDGAILFTDPSRQACLEWEREYFNAKEADSAVYTRDPDVPARRPAA